MLSLICPRNAFRTFSSTGTAIFVSAPDPNLNFYVFFLQILNLVTGVVSFHGLTRCTHTSCVACVLSFPGGTHTTYFTALCFLCYFYSSAIRWSDASGRFCRNEKETEMRHVKVKATASTAKKSETSQSHAINEYFIDLIFVAGSQLSVLQPNRSVYESSISLKLYSSFSPFACVVAAAAAVPPSEFRPRVTSKKNVAYAFTLAAAVVGCTHTGSPIEMIGKKIDKTNTWKAKYKSNCACVQVQANLFVGSLTDSCVRNIFRFFSRSFNFICVKYIFSRLRALSEPTVVLYRILSRLCFICSFHCSLRYEWWIGNDSR